MFIVNKSKAIRSKQVSCIKRSFSVSWRRGFDSDQPTLKSFSVVFSILISFLNLNNPDMINQSAMSLLLGTNNFLTLSYF